MSRRGKLTVELFRDAETPDVSLDGVIAGVEKIQEITDLVEITRTDRTTRFMLPGMLYIPGIGIVPPNTEADMAIIFTKTQFHSRYRAYDKEKDTQGPGTVGRATFNLRKKPYAQAVVSDDPYINIPDTVAHETAHMLDLDHCACSTCLMHWRIEENNTGFCSDHRAQLARNAFNLVNYDNVFTTRLGRKFEKPQLPRLNTTWLKRLPASLAG